jgi:hypothetical protein
MRDSAEIEKSNSRCVSRGFHANRHRYYRILNAARSILPSMLAGDAQARLYRSSKPFFAMLILVAGLSAARSIGLRG